jgi:ubiquinol oxidase
VHHPTETTSDKVARGMVKTARWTFDFVTGYKHASQEAAREAAVKAGKGDLSVEELIEQGFVMSKDQWLSRVLFLESFAAVPGTMAAVCRHLQSLRLMRRDHGWIHTLLQEAENERMHLLTFIKLAQPGTLFRLMVLATQGVSCAAVAGCLGWLADCDACFRAQVTFNAFFLVYLFKPSAAHRFVGYLEQEAVYTCELFLICLFSSGHARS